MKANKLIVEPVRQRLLQLVEERGTNLANVSRAIGKNHAYLHQFINRKKPKYLPEMVRHALAHHFSIDENELMSSTQKIERIRLLRRASSQNRVGSSYLYSFAARLSHARAESNFHTTPAFSEAAGIGLDRYLLLESGGDNPSLDELDRISLASGKSLEWLIRGDLPDAAPDKMARELPASHTAKRRL